MVALANTAHLRFGGTFGRMDDGGLRRLGELVTGGSPSGDGPTTVLIADDDGDLRALYRRLLERSGSFAVVGEAANGFEAVELSAVHQPCIVLLDVLMPELDGLAALPMLAVAVPRALIVANSADADAAELARSRGAHAVVRKDGYDVMRLPSDLDELWRTFQATRSVG